MLYHDEGKITLEKSAYKIPSYTEAKVFGIKVSSFHHVCIFQGGAAPVCVAAARSGHQGSKLCARFSRIPR